MTFAADLTSSDRGVVHNLSRRYGFETKSRGKGDERRMTVYKSIRKNTTATTYAMQVTPKAEMAVGQHFEHFPPTEAELNEVLAPEPLDGGEASSSSTVGSNGSQGSSTTKMQPRRKRMRSVMNLASRFSEEQVMERWKAVCERRRTPGMAEINAAREALPIVKHREEILEAMKSNQVVLVCGETGSGKTTQIPQYIMDDCWSRGEPCKIMCTQPRRLSAISISERVAVERGEAIGDNVGYTIRLEAKGGPQSSLVFCTNGILLRIATKGGDLDDFTHVILDEVHERDAFADFLLITLRDVLPNHPNLKLVLMSATLQHQLFSDYFGGCPILYVQGRTFAVEDFYLEDILRLTGYEQEVTGRRGGTGAVKKQPYSTAQQRCEVEDAIRNAFTSGRDEAFERLLEVTGAQSEGSLVNIQHSGTGATALIAAASWGRLSEVCQLLEKGADVLIQAFNGLDAVACAEQCGHHEVAGILRGGAEAADQVNSLRSSSMALDHYHSNSAADEVDLDLIHRLLMYICGEGQYKKGSQDVNIPMGAVLVFMPGWDEIIRMKTRLEKDVFGRGRYQILPLHSMVPPAEQRRVFVRPPPGVRKLILATNIAESAVTIDDVVVVLNSGRLKEKSYDPYTNVSILQSTWTSRASERQRRGRAGRCQEGVAFHMYSRARSASLPEFQEPELKRCPLEELCLQVKMLDMPGGQQNSIGEFLGRAPSPPVTKAIESARNVLIDIGALTEDEGLTTLGRHLAALPLPPQLGKLCLYGILFKCLDPVLTVACSMSYRDPWLNPTGDGERAQAKSIRAEMAELGGAGSDHLAIVTAYDRWLVARRSGRDWEFCRKNFVSHATLSMIHGMREQLVDELRRRGLVGSMEGCSVNARDPEVVRCILACGLYPRVGCSHHGKPGAILTRKGEKAFIHQASVNVKLSAPKPTRGKPPLCPLVAFDELVRGESRLYIRACTALHPQPLPLIAGSLELLKDEEDKENDPRPQMQRETKAILYIDRWLRFETRQELGVQLCVLRKRLQRAFAQKVNASRSRLPEELQDAVDASGRFMSDAYVATPAGSPGPYFAGPPGPIPRRPARVPQRPGPAAHVPRTASARGGGGNGGAGVTEGQRAFEERWNLGSQPALGASANGGADHPIDRSPRAEAGHSNRLSDVRSIGQEGVRASRRDVVLVSRRDAVHASRREGHREAAHLDRGGRGERHGHGGDDQRRRGDRRGAGRPAPARDQADRDARRGRRRPRGQHRKPRGGSGGERNGAPGAAHSGA